MVGQILPLFFCLGIPYLFYVVSTANILVTGPKVWSNVRSMIVCDLILKFNSCIGRWGISNRNCESKGFRANRKDYLCIERPLSPPVRRLVIGSYHLEYGFPSTHSANALGMSIILYYFLTQVRKTMSFLVDYKLMEPHAWSILLNYPLPELLILLYATTVIYGRLYLGMHSLLGVSFHTDLKIVLSVLSWGQLPHLERYGSMDTLSKFFDGKVVQVRAQNMLMCVQFLRQYLH